MKLRFISPTAHGIIDYAAAIALVTAPFLLKLGSSNPAALWTSVMTGIVVALVSVSTDYRYGVLKMLPFDDHLALDLLVATAFMLLPYVLMLDGLDAAYYYANAAVVYLVVALTSTAKLTSK